MNIQVICCQETRILQHSLAKETEWCANVGWLAVLSPAVLSAKGFPCQGTGILVRQGYDFGITKLQLPEDFPSPRATVISLEVPGHQPLCLGSIYLADSVGLNDANLTALASVVQVAAHNHLPIILAGDFNVCPRQVIETEFPTRAGVQVIIPDQHTLYTKKGKSIIDYFMGSRCFEHYLTQPRVLVDYPSSPHRPVVMDMVIGAPYLIPVLVQPQVLPVEAPVGPRNFCPTWSRSLGPWASWKACWRIGMFIMWMGREVSLCRSSQFR